MWKNMVLVAGLLGCLTIPSLGGGASPAYMIDAGKPNTPRVIDGKLVYHDGSGPRIDEVEPWIGPALETGGSWFGLDFGDNQQLLRQAEKLYGKKVRVTGRLEKRTLAGLWRQEIDVLVVSDVRPIEAVQQTIQVEIKGTLSGRPMIDNPARIPEDLLPLHAWTIWHITADATTYELDFGAARNLEALAGKLDGRTVILTGTREGNVVHVKSLKADGPYIKETVSVVLHGKLHYVLTDAMTGKVLSTHDERPTAYYECTRLWHGVTIDGKLYLLDLADNKVLATDADKLAGKVVVVAGTLKGDVVTLASVKPAQ
jgi:hypothetical protein